MTGATIEEVRTLSYIPVKGQRFLSVNLAMVDLVEIGNIAKDLGFKMELVKIPSRSGTQIHALLWEGAISDTPADMDNLVDTLAERIENPDAIRYAAGAWTHKAA
jgi:hypothetical protein